MEEMEKTVYVTDEEVKEGLCGGMVSHVFI